MSHPADVEFEALKTLIAELRGRLPPNLTERQFADVGNWMLKALWLGQGKPLEEVFASVEPAKPKLRLIECSNSPTTP